MVNDQKIHNLKKNAEIKLATFLLTTTFLHKLNDFVHSKKLRLSLRFPPQNENKNTVDM